MRIMFCGNFSQVRSTEGYVAAALESLEGVTVSRVQENMVGPHEVTHQIQKEKPDVFLFSKCEYRGMPFKQEKSRELLRRALGDIRGLGVKVVSWVFDLMRPEFSVERYEWAKAVSSQCHLFLTTDTYSEGFKNHRCLRQGYPGPPPGSPREPFSMAGIQYEALHLGELYGERRQWYRVVNQRLENRFGVVRGVYEDRLHSLLGSVKLVLGPPYPYYAGYWSNRIYLVAGHGACLLAPIVPGMEQEGWRHGENMLGCPRSPEVQAEMAFDLLKQPDLLREIGENAARFVWENHTYNHRAKVLLGWLEELS